VDYTFEPEAWDILIRSDRAEPEAREFGVDAYDPTPLHRVGLAIHKNERLGLVSGENFTHILAGRENTLFRELYRRTLHYLLDGAKATGSETNLADPTPRSSTLFAWDRPVRIGAVRYELPEFIDFRDLGWRRKPAPYAHYVLEGSADGERWVLLADRRHGPWRGMKTDRFPILELKYLRFDGTFSNREPFRVRNLHAFEAH
jgi:hypothetical protein